MKTTKRNKKDLIDIDIIDLNGSSKDGGKEKERGKEDRFRKENRRRKKHGFRGKSFREKSFGAEERPRAKAPKAARAALARQLPVESPQHRYAGREQPGVCGYYLLFSGAVYLSLRIFCLFPTI